MIKNQKPIISKQLSLDQVVKCCNDDIKDFAENFFRLEHTWLHNAYNAFKDIEKYLILVFLINKTLKTYNDHFYNLSFEKFYKLDQFEIEKINIIEIVKELSISKETARRKLNELNQEGIIKRNRKEISVINPFKDQKPINNIIELSKLLKWVSFKLNKIYGLNSFDSGYFLNIIKKNYTRNWHIFFNFQLKYILGAKKVYGSYDAFYIFACCALNQSYNLKNFGINNQRKIINLLNFPDVITEYTKLNSKGLNATTISEITGMPRASVIRKLKYLVNKKLLFKNNQNLFIISTPKDQPIEFKKLRNLFEKNQLLIRMALKDLLNQTII